MTTTLPQIPSVPGGEAAPSAGPPDELDRLVLGITRWTVASESVFLEVGERLRTAHGRIAEVREGIARATEVFTHPVMAEARGGLVEAAASVETAWRLTAERRDRIGELNAAVERARDGSASLKTVFRVLDYIVVIARAQVESMKGAEVDLVSFSRTVDDLVTSGTAVAQSIDERMDTLRAALQESRAIVGRSLATVDGRELAHGFQALIGRMAEEQDVAASKREEAQVAFTAVWRAVAAAVMGLQAHDMARQRLEHTVRNLDRIGPLARDGTFEPGEAPLAPAHRRAAIHRVARLEMAQLDDLAATYGALMDRLALDLAAIADRLDDCGRVLESLRVPEVAGRGVAALEGGASRLRAAMEAGGEARRALAASLARSVERTALLIEMTDQMTGLEFHLNLAGLNAAIQAAHVEGGDETIGYIARVIREQSSQARAEVDTIRAGIEQAAEATRDLAGRLLPAIAEAEASVDRNLTAACAGLAAAEGDSCRALAASAEAADGMGDEIRSVLRMMALHEEGTRVMRALSAAVGTLVGEPAEAELPPADAARLDAVLCAGYTMKEERGVFAAALGPPAAVPGAGADASPAAGDDFDDILF
ncbi:hypothetical protein D3218_05005 [Aureimonas flava]|uniref:Methyl-accepting chemotaxis protein n=1 Tax=Aureimonas flava TaxID=2320271 RepID=A0A3A1WMD1_9HYPH|nr:hypothetical protein [Aureimonas flava]RIY02716.1 hypothetical protein D3218_05005 [Aureimonas flava]